MRREKTDRSGRTLGEDLLTADTTGSIDCEDKGLSITGVFGEV